MIIYKQDNTLLSFQGWNSSPSPPQQQRHAWRATVAAGGNLDIVLEYPSRTASAWRQN